jgi:hypothetical protein
VRFFGTVDSDEILLKAIDAAAPDENLVLVAVSGGDNMVTELNMIAQWR